MAGFKQHMTFSTICGVGYGAATYYYGAPWETCAVAGGMCALSGMLPDLDSDSGRPVEETTTVVAALAPMMMVDRFAHMGLSHDQMILVTAGIYFFVRFIAAGIFKRYTVHRGMWHSIPACLSVGLLTFLICSSEVFNLRLIKAGAVMLGFFSHLLLDEIWSIDSSGMRMKSSFGTAMKFWGDKTWANLSCYGKLIVLGLLAAGDPLIMNRFGIEDNIAIRLPREVLRNAQVEIEKRWR
jgi:hypothetical protein